MDLELPISSVPREGPYLLDSSPEREGQEPRIIFAIPTPAVLEMLIKRCGSHVVLVIEREEASCFSLLVSCVLPVEDGLWRGGLGRAGISLPEGLSSFHCL